MTISATQVQELRKKTGAGMMDCKQALVETKGDLEEAVTWLRKKGLSTAAKKSDRIAVEGLVGMEVGDKVASIVEINCETDFVAKNEKFQQLVKTIAKIAVKADDLVALEAANITSNKTVNEDIIEHISILGENIKLRRMSVLKVQNGVIASYVHNSVAPDLGKIGVIVGLESTGDKSKLIQIGKQIAMHIAATKPLSIDVSSLDQSLVEQEKEVFTEQSKASGKPSDIIAKMVEGRIRKFYEEVVLLEQIFIIDNKTKIVDIIANASKEIGATIAITGFAVFGVGEGLA